MKTTHAYHCAAAAIALLSFATTTRGAVFVPITNAGFEDPVQPDGAYTDAGNNMNAITGWTEINGADGGVWNVTTADFPAEAPEGVNVAWIYSYATSTDQGFGQVLSGPAGLLQADSSYTLTAMVGNSASYAGYPGYKVQLRVGATVLAEDDNTLPPGEGLFVASTVNYTFNVAHSALVGLPLEIRLLSKDLVYGAQTEFDDVKLSTTAVPEPSHSLALLVLGATGLLTRRRRN